MTNMQAPITDVEVDMRSLMRALFRALPLILLCVALVGGGVFFLLREVAPKYRSQATILIEAGESEFTRSANAPAPTNDLFGPEAVASQVQVFQSRDLARRVAERLDLASKPEFNPALRGDSLFSDILAALGLGKDPSRSSTEELVLEHFAKELSAYAVPQSRVIIVEFSSEDPELAADIANAVADEYIALQRAAKRDMTTDATKWLESEIEGLRVRVQEAEAKVETYRSSNDLFTGGGQTPATLPQQQLADLNTELARVRAARAEAQAKANQIRTAIRQGNGLAQTEVLNSQLIQRLVEQQVALRAHIAQLSATYLPEHPRMRELSAQVLGLDRQIAQEAQKILEGLEAEVGLTEAREREIQQSLAGLKSAAARANDAEVDLRALEREAAAQRDLLDSYLRRYRDALARQQGDYLPADARIISRATVPIEPHFPNKPALTAVAIIATLLIGIALTLIRELASGRSTRRVLLEPPPPPEDPRPVRWQEDQGIRRMLPYAPGEASRPEINAVLVPVARQIVTEGYKRLMTVAVEGSEPQPVAVTLARIIAAQDRRPVIIDLRRDGLNTDSLGGGSDLPGFSDLMAGSASFAQVIFRDRQSRVHFIPRGLAPLRRGELGEEKVGLLLDALDHTYDHVVLDVADGSMALLSPDCDAVVIVSDFESTDPRTITTFEEVRAATDAKIILVPLAIVAEALEVEESAGAAA
jgi:succinoglycan biosynthesis transport protein ExoP